MAPVNYSELKVFVEEKHDEVGEKQDILSPSKLNVDHLSPHLFWDVDKRSININDDIQFIVQRILEYGLINDWMQIYLYLGIDKIADIAMEIRDLDDKALSFISALAKKPKEQFKCYTIQQSTPHHWNF